MIKITVEIISYIVLRVVFYSIKWRNVKHLMYKHTRRDQKSCVCVRAELILCMRNRCKCGDNAPFCLCMCEFCKSVCVGAVLKSMLPFCLHCNELCRIFLLSPIHKRALFAVIPFFSLSHKHECILYWSRRCVFCSSCRHSVICTHSFSVLNVNRQVDIS